MLARKIVMLTLGLALTLNAFGATTITSASIENLSLKTSDGVEIFAKEYHTEKSRAIILAFHQAGSNKSEYATIAPRLAQAGYTVIAIDQRSGGNMFKQSNQTVEKIGHNSPYLATLPDLDAALAFARESHLPVAVWGSSYSSSLVFALAAKHKGEIAALLSFSPGEYFDDKQFVKTAAAQVDIPVFITSAKDKEEIASASDIFAATASKLKTQFIPKLAGVHGSSTLITQRNPKGEAENWAAVLDFLNKTFPAN